MILASCSVILTKFVEGIVNTGIAQLVQNISQSSVRVLFALLYIFCLLIQSNFPLRTIVIAQGAFVNIISESCAVPIWICRGSTVKEGATAGSYTHCNQCVGYWLSKA